MALMKILDDQVTKHFALHESRCKAGGEVLITPEVIQFFQMLEEFRVWYNRVMIASSWYRTERHNADVKGSPKSQHLLGIAADFHFPASDHGKLWTARRRYEFLVNVRAKWYELCDKYGVKGGVGWYDWGFHLDSGDAQRDRRSFWDYRSNKTKHFSVSKKNGKLRVRTRKEA